MVTRTQVAARTRAPLSPEARRLVERSEVELAAAALCTDPGDEFRHAHLAAVRAAAAVLEVTGRPGGRPAPRTVWDMLHAAVPELGPWARFFAAGAPLRAALEAGRAEVAPSRAAELRESAEDFLDTVRVWLAQDALTETDQRRAS